MHTTVVLIIITAIICIVNIQSGSGYDLVEILRRYEKNIHSTVPTKAGLPVSEECWGQLTEILNVVNNISSIGIDFLDGIEGSALLESFNASEWALQMLDATGKIPAGLMEYNVISMGRFMECLNIEDSIGEVKGQFCLTGLGIDNRFLVRSEPSKSLNINKYLRAAFADKLLPIVPGLPFWGVCIPEKCTKKDLLSVLKTATPDLPWGAICQTKNDITKPFDTGAILTLSFFGLITAIMAVSTLYDYLTRNSKQQILLTAFSVKTNGTKVFAVKKKSGEFSCLYGIKCLSMMYVILGHLSSTFLGTPMTNMLTGLDYLNSTNSMFFGNAQFAVDTFFVMTGMLVVYNFMILSHNGSKMNLVVFYLHRYLRLTPAIIPVLLTSIYLTDYIGNGPLHPLGSSSVTEVCKSNWWTVLLYAQNYLSEKTCIIQTWYLAIDFQLYAISPVFLYLLPKHPKIGLGIMGVAALGTMIWSFVVTWKYQLASLLSEGTRDLQLHWEHYYTMPQCRGSTYFIGGFLGFFFAKMTQGKNLIFIKLNKFLVVFLWIACMTIMLVCVFAGQKVLTSNVYYPYEHAFHNTFSKPAWGLCVCWVIFACSFGYGGIINKFLSLPIFQVMRRFTYSMFLNHVTLMIYINLNLKEPIELSVFYILFTFWAVTALSFGISILMVLAFESPVVALEKYVLPGVSSRPNTNEKNNNGVNSKQDIKSKILQFEQA